MNETIGKRIAAYRRGKGMTQEELAQALGVSGQAVSKWENDASCPDISLLPKLGKILGITVDELLTGEPAEVRLVPVEQRKRMDELVMRIRVNSSDGDKIRVNLPLPLVKACLDIGADVTMGAGSGNAMKDVDFGKVLMLAEHGAIGKLVELESADGDFVEIVVE